MPSGNASASGISSGPTIGPAPPVPPSPPLAPLPPEPCPPAPPPPIEPAAEASCCSSPHPISAAPEVATTALTNSRRLVQLMPASAERVRRKRGRGTRRKRGQPALLRGALSGRSLGVSGGDLHETRAYYDEFSQRYEDKRGGREPGGYHDLIDDLEVDLVARHATGKDVLEVGCGTGLLLERFAKFAKSAKGVDLSPGMLEKARGRGLDVAEASASELPFEAGSFDVACSFKVL